MSFIPFIRTRGRDIPTMEGFLEQRDDIGRLKEEVAALRKAIEAYGIPITEGYTFMWSKHSGSMSIPDMLLTPKRLRTHNDLESALHLLAEKLGVRIGTAPASKEKTVLTPIPTKKGSRK